MLLGGTDRQHSAKLRGLSAEDPGVWQSERPALFLWLVKPPGDRVGPHTCCSPQPHTPDPDFLPRLSPSSHRPPPLGLPPRKGRSTGARGRLPGREGAEP